MHRKVVFALAGVFLAVALVVPPILLIVQSDNDLDNYLTHQNDQGLKTGGNGTLVFLQEINEGRQNMLIIIAVIEVVFVLLFAITMYYGINHPHPEH